MDRELGPHRKNENSNPTHPVVQARGTPSARRRKNAANIDVVSSSGLIILLKPPAFQGTPE